MLVDHITCGYSDTKYYVCFHISRKLHLRSLTHYICQRRCECVVIFEARIFAIICINSETVRWIKAEKWPNYSTKFIYLLQLQTIAFT